VRHGGDEIARRDADGAQRQRESVGAVADPDPVRRADIGCELLLERGDLLSEDVPAAFEHAPHRRIDRFPMRAIAGAEVALRDHRYRSRFSRKKASVRLSPSARGTLAFHCTVSRNSESAA